MRCCSLEESGRSKGKNNSVSSEEVQVDPSKIESLISWQAPKDIKSLRGFLELTGYYRKFVKDYGKIAAPLTDLLKKDAFSWGERAQQPFEALKLSMTQEPVLAMPNFSQPFVIETDASGFGVSAVLMQNGKPITYFGRMLSSRARQCSVYERELMAIVLAIKRWNHYLMGHHFIIRTDQKALKFLLEQRVMDENQQKWVSKLMGNKFEIKYKPDAENRVADALSRHGESAELYAFSIWKYEDKEEWDQEVHKTPK
ncbi:putative purple acid phosphatase 18-like isoform X1 [Capsicum annuum]|nr:putative purple acid phosphatase 18-like isoform X1 [Capsicum annuum]